MLGESFGHPAQESVPWIEDGSIWQGADMWAKPDESSEYITDLYRRARAHADGVIAALDLEAPGWVAHWPEGRQDTTLGFILIRMVAETACRAATTSKSSPSRSTPRPRHSPRSTAGPRRTG